MSLDKEQQGVLRGMIAAAIVSVVVLDLAWMAWPFAPVAASGVAERLAFAIRLDLLLAVWPLVFIGAVAKGRFFSKVDIAGAAFGPPSPKIAVPAALLANSLEQAAIAIPAHLALATLLPAGDLHLLVAFVGLFVVGRIAFAAGYSKGAATRSFGFALTFYPTVFAYLLALVLMVVGWLS